MADPNKISQSLPPSWAATFLWVHRAITLVLFAFAMRHAFTMFITHDEAFSFYLVHTRYLRAMAGTANNHWLNSFFMWFAQLFTYNAGALRLHSVLALPFFCEAVYRVSRQIPSIFPAVLFYCCIVFNPYLLDFFSLARGYGIALTFQAWAFVFAMLAIGHPFSYRRWLFVLALCVGAVAANLSYIYTVIGMLSAFAFLFFLRTDEYNLKNKKAIRIAALFLTMICLTAIDLAFIRHSGDLEYGGDSNFFASVFGSLAQGTMYNATQRSFHFGGGVEVGLIAILSMIIVLVTAISRKRYQLLAIVCPLLCLCIINIVLHVVLHIPYLLFRTALQYYVPSIFAICYAGSLIPFKLSRVTNAVLCVCVFILCAGFFAVRANIHYCFEFYDQADSKNALNDLYDLHQKKVVGHKWLGGVYQNYYQLTDPQLASMPVKFINEDTAACGTAYFERATTADAVVVPPSKLYDCLVDSPLYFKPVKIYPFTHAVLLVNER